MIKSIFCKHTYDFVRNIHGDEINMYFPIKISVWQCKKCSKYKLESKSFQ